MDEEPNEHELEERLYAMLHYVDDTQANANIENQKDLSHIIDNAPRSTVRRYWRTGTDQSTLYKKVNTPKDNAPATTDKNPLVNNRNTQPKEEKCETASIPSADLSLFQSPPQIINKTIEIIEQENNTSVLLETSDEDEVIEVELPPKPTITIESSDEDEVCIVSKSDIPATSQKKKISENSVILSREREISASPVPSVVSSVSDEFIRSDCIALNISSRHPDNHSFDFSLHGSDLLGQVTPSKKKKKKKSKEAITSTPVGTVSEKNTNTTVETCFATPKSKAKNKKQRTKSYTVSEKSVPSADVYDSDSNQSVIDINKEKRIYSVSVKSTPSADVYESDSSLHEIINTSKPFHNSEDNVINSSDSSISLDKPDEISKTTQHEKSSQVNETTDSFIDLTGSDKYVTLDSTGITENIVMANVTGFKKPECYGNKSTHQNDAPKFGSTKVPQILFENLDFDNLKGKDKVCKRRRYSLTTLRAEMEKFYNESWGGEDFNHREIQKYMSRDKSLWVIDPKDRMPSLTKRKTMCNYCNRPGHRDDTCRMKPPVCYMCGSTGHFEPRCPSKICVNCGSPNYMYSTMCRNCSTWGRLTCSECSQTGHPASHCPDLWRRYHNTIDNNVPLVENRQMKKNNQLYCSGCSRRGHLVHTCRASLPFSGLPINSPFVNLYRPLYMASSDQSQNQICNQRSNSQDATISSASLSRKDKNKRQSKSPTLHENHVYKKKNMTITDVTKVCEKPRNNDGRQRKNSIGKNQTEDCNKVPKDKCNQEAQKTAPDASEKAPDFIPISSTNHDKKGHMIQDNEVSDTSEVVTCSRIYFTSDISDKLKTKAGENWLQENTKKYSVDFHETEIKSFFSIKGKFCDQEAFQAALRQWNQRNSNKDNTKLEGEERTSQEMNESAHMHNIPRNRNSALRKLTNALHSLKEDLGEPEAIYKKLNFLQKRHEQLLNEKVISSAQVSINRGHINLMLKKLNMVLIGQAGLADGAMHLNELYALHEKISNIRQKNITPDLRWEIGQHYRLIFTAIARDDYTQLLQTYYSAKSKKKVATKNKSKFTPKKGNKGKKCKTGTPSPIAPPTSSPAPAGNVVPAGAVCPAAAQHQMPSMSKLSFFHMRILNSRPVSKAKKKMRVELARKLHSLIATMFKKERMSSKTLKKLNKTKYEAQAFLNSV